MKRTKIIGATDGLERELLLAGEPNSVDFITCPACKGKGVLPPPKERTVIYDTDGTLAYTAKSLAAKGYTYREIAEIMGYKHVGSIGHLINKHKQSGE